MPDDPRIPDDVPTSPDLATFPCPYCVDEHGRPSGGIMSIEESASGVRGVRVTCGSGGRDGCGGSMRVSRELMARFQATRQGRPR